MNVRSRFSHIRRPFIGALLLILALSFCLLALSSARGGRPLVLIIGHDPSVAVARGGVFGTQRAFINCTGGTVTANFVPLCRCTRATADSIALRPWSMTRIAFRVDTRRLTAGKHAESVFVNYAAGPRKWSEELKVYPRVTGTAAVAYGVTGNP